MQDVAGNSPSLPLRPPIHGASRNAVETLLWNGSSHATLLPLCDTHLKQSMQYPVQIKRTDYKHDIFTKNQITYHNGSMLIELLRDIQNLCSTFYEYFILIAESDWMIFDSLDWKIITLS